jgi:hypothetical protein
MRPANSRSGKIPLEPPWEMGIVHVMEYTIKETHFELLTEVQKTDAKKRLSLGSAVQEDGAVYNIYRNRLGQIMLDPVKAVPAYEAWLFGNKPALASVKRGLEDSAAGRTKNLGSFATHAKG